MPSNEVTLVNAAIEEWVDERSSLYERSVIFELFAAEKAMCELELSDEEIEAGRIGGAQDGGIDAVFTVLGERLIDEDDELVSPETKPSDYERNQTLSLYILQAKEESSFTETAIDKLASSLSRLLPLEPNYPELETLYSPQLLSRFEIFRKAWRKLSTRLVHVKLTVFYATLGDISSVNERVQLKADALIGSIQPQLVGGSSCFTFLGATELWSAHQTLPSYSLKLRFEKHENDGDSHLALVKVSDYAKFIEDETDGSLLRHIFDWNVRDYQKGVTVNREIARSLESAGAPDFWWLNNGITILCSGQVRTAGSEFILDDVQIVNGLQTSHTIHHSMKDPAVWEISKDRKLLVRILSTDDPEVRDQVIRATNSQTQVSDASLRATDKIQRQIESYFLSKGWFYDRRKNFYKNSGKRADRIISIAYLAQAVMAIGLSEPSSSRARPSTLIRKDEDYSRIFSERIGLDVYLWLAKTQKSVDAFLQANSDATTAERSNLRFYVSMIAVARLNDGKIYSPTMLSAFAQNDAQIDPEAMKIALADVRNWTAQLCVEKGYTQDRAAKSVELSMLVLEKLFPPSDESDLSEE